MEAILGEEVLGKPQRKRERAQGEALGDRLYSQSPAAQRARALRIAAARWQQKPAKGPERAAFGLGPGLACCLGARSQSRRESCRAPAGLRAERPGLTLEVPRGGRRLFLGCPAH